jgi:hypothetical protein
MKYGNEDDKVIIEMIKDEELDLIEKSLRKCNGL